MIAKILTEHHLEFLSLTGGCRGSSESTLVKISNCWECHAMAQLIWFPCGDTLHKLHKYSGEFNKFYVFYNCSI